MSKKFNFEDIENDPTVKKFFIKKPGFQPNTIESYIYSLLLFCNYTNKSPTEIFEIHRDDLRERKEEFDQWLNEALDNYVAHLTNSGNTYYTIRLRISRIKGFLHAFKLKPTPDPVISKKNIVEASKYALTVEDIRLAIKQSPLDYQTLFITQAQTGLSVSDALLLNIKDFIDAVSKRKENLTLEQALKRVETNKNLIGCFDLRRKKTSVEFYTFAGPEVLKSMALLLKSRNAKYLKPDMPIFFKNMSKVRSKQGKMEITDLRLTTSAVENYTSRLHDPKGKAVFPKIMVDGKKRNYFRTHKLRKWYSNRVYHDAGFKFEDTKYLMGQKTGDVVEHYIDPNNFRSLLKKYKKALPFLAITEKITIEENKEAIEKVEKENQRLREQSEKESKIREEEIERLKAEKDEEIRRLNEKIKFLTEEIRLTRELVTDLSKIAKGNR